MSPGVLVSLLLACNRQNSGESADSAPPFDDPLDPDAEHILAASVILSSGHALAELRPDLSAVWTHDLELGSGAQGAARLADGSTVYSHVQAPPVYDSAIELIDASGALRWSYDELFLLGFSHGVAATPAGDFVTLDTIGGKILSFDTSGAELWSLRVSDETGAYRPNGLSLREGEDGVVHVAVTLLEATDSGEADALALYTLGERTELPTLAWRVPVATRSGDGAWPHGPRLREDGTLMACHSANGQVVGYDLASGAELWRLPEDEAAPRFAFPRDALFLSDGSLVVADAGSELVRVSDPFDAFEVVAAATTPGIFGISPVICGEGGGLPCLGEP